MAQKDRIKREVLYLIDTNAEHDIDRMRVNCVICVKAMILNCDDVLALKKTQDAAPVHPGCYEAALAKWGEGTIVGQL